MNELEKMAKRARDINKKNLKRARKENPNAGNVLLNNFFFNSQYRDNTGSSKKEIVDVDGSIGDTPTVLDNGNSVNSADTGISAVGGEGGAMGESLLESSLSKLNNYLQSGNICFITANKNYHWLKDKYKEQIKDVPSDKVIRVLQKINRERNKALENELKGLGYTYFKVDGSYENQERKQNYINRNNITDIDNYQFSSEERKQFTDKEESFAVIDKFNNYNSFISNMKKLMKDYDQESILVFRVNDKSGRFIYSNGEEELISGYKFGIDFPFKSLISGRPFVVESISDEIYIPKHSSNQFNSDNDIDDFLKNYLIKNDLDIDDIEKDDIIKLEELEDNKINKDIYYHAQINKTNNIPTNIPRFFSRDKEYSIEYLQEDKGYLYTCNLIINNPFDCSTDEQIEMLYAFEDYCYISNIPINQDGLNKSYKNHKLYFTIVDDVDGKYYFYNWLKSTYPEFDTIIVDEGQSFNGNNQISYIPLRESNIKIVDITEIN